MRHILRSLVPFAASFAAAAVLTIVPIEVSVGSDGSLITASLQSACASPVGAAGSAVQNGSCKPRANWVCGLNGQNYENKEYVAAQE